MISSPPGLAVDVPDVVIRAVTTAIAWAYRRGIGLSSACGIWIALAVCAATWFSAGTRTSNLRGVAAMWAGYLVLVAGQHLTRGSGGAMADAEAMAEPGDGLMAAASGQFPAADRRAAGPVGWLAALGSGLAESVVYVGLALGAVAGNWPDGWTLAIAVLGLCAVRNLMTACSTPPGFGAEPDGLLSRVTGAIVTMPPGGRVLLVGIVAPVWGARAALLALVDWSIISVGFGIAGRARAAANADRPDGQASALVRLRDDGALARGLGSLVRGGLLPLPPAVLGLAAVAALALACLARPGWCADHRRCDRHAAGGAGVRASAHRTIRLASPGDPARRAGSLPVRDRLCRWRACSRRVRLAGGAAALVRRPGKSGPPDSAHQAQAMSAISQPSAVPGSAGRAGCCWPGSAPRSASPRSPT